MTMKNEQALARVGKYLGLPISVLGEPSSIKLEKFVIKVPLSEYDGTPRSCWKIDYKEISFSPLETAAKVSMSCSVVLDATTGELIEVCLNSGRQNTDFVASPTGELARCRLAESGEHYRQLVSEPPRVTFIDALKQIETSGFVRLEDSNTVEAVLVMHEWLEHAVRPVWAIVFNGLPPWPVEPPPGTAASDVPVWQRNHLRHVIDASNGEVLFATTIPQPEEGK
jgi:hypothetical protein